MKVQKNCYYLIKINLNNLMNMFETNKESEKTNLIQVIHFE
jgi:hypothetical protein